MAQDLGQIAQGADVDAAVRLGGPAPPILLEATASNRDVLDPQLPGHALQESRLLVAGFEDREASLGPYDGERNARESSAAADVESRGGTRRLDIHGIQRIEDMSRMEVCAVAK